MANRNPGGKAAQNMVQGMQNAGNNIADAAQTMWNATAEVGKQVGQGVQQGVQQLTNRGQSGNNQK